MTPSSKRLTFDTIGYWSEIKLDIVKVAARIVEDVFDKYRNRMA